MSNAKKALVADISRAEAEIERITEDLKGDHLGIILAMTRDSVVEDRELTNKMLYLAQLVVTKSMAEQVLWGIVERKKFKV